MQCLRADEGYFQAQCGKNQDGRILYNFRVKVWQVTFTIKSRIPEFVISN